MFKIFLLTPERTTKPEQRGGGCGGSDDEDEEEKEEEKEEEEEEGGGSGDDTAFRNMLINYNSHIHILHSFSHCCFSFYLLSNFLHYSSFL
jgi:hypothetical protein